MTVVSEALAASADAADHLAALAEHASPRGRHAALLFLTGALRQTKSKHRAALAAAVLRVLRAAGFSLLAAPEGTAPEVLADGVKSVGAAEHLKTLVGDAALATACAGRAALSLAQQVASPKSDSLAIEVLTALAPLAATDESVLDLAQGAADLAASSAPAVLAHLAADPTRPQEVAATALRQVPHTYTSLACSRALLCAR